MVSVVRFIPMTCYVRVVVWFTKLPHKSLQAVHSLSMVSEVMDRYSALAGRLTIWFSLRLVCFVVNASLVIFGKSLTRVQSQSTGVRD